MATENEMPPQPQGTELALEPAPDSERDAALDADTLNKITIEYYQQAEKHFSGSLKESREDYLDNIVQLINETLQYEAISETMREELEDFKTDFVNLKKLKVRTDHQSKNEFSNLGEKSNRHSNAFFAMSVEILKAELENLKEMGRSRADLTNQIQALKNSIQGGVPVDAIDNMVSGVQTAVTEFVHPNEQSVVRMKAKITGLLKSFYDNCSHTVYWDGTKYVGGKGRYMPAMRSFFERSMKISDFRQMTYSRYPTDAISWLRLAHLYDTEREWVVNALAFSTLEDSLNAQGDSTALSQIRALKRRHFRKAPDHIKFYVKDDTPDDPPYYDKYDYDQHDYDRDVKRPRSSYDD